MTTLGKILVFVNLVFSVITGALIVMVFSTRTNWQSSYKKLETYYKVSEANVKAYAEDIKALKAKDDAEVKRLNGELAKLNGQVTALNKALSDKDLIHKADMSKLREAGLNDEAITRELLQRRDEVKQLQGIVATRDEKLLALETKNKDLLDRYVRADIAARSAHDRAQRLVETVDGLSKEVDRLKIGGSLAGATERKPPEDVKGIILETDAKNNLVTISIGSDSGISKGNTLEVYRLKPEPKYLGKIRVLEVNHHEAVAKPVAVQRTAMIQKGDTVASTIMDQR